jgi:hypothetical protein
MNPKTEQSQTFTDPTVCGPIAPALRGSGTCDIRQASRSGSHRVHNDSRSPANVLGGGVLAALTLGSA